MDRRFDAAIEKVREGSNFIVVSHVNPEGDALGSLLGLTLALRLAGKSVTAYMEDNLPDILEFLPGSDTLTDSRDGKGPFDATIAVDCGQKDRLGASLNLGPETGTLINIDHHGTNDEFGDINVVEPEASSAGEMVYDFLVAAGLEINKDIATCLYVAISTDTGSFRYSSAKSETFRKAGELVALGADPWDVASHVYENHPENKLKLFSMVLGTLEVVTCDTFKVATMYVTLDMFERAGADKDLSEGFVNYARAVTGVEVGLLFRENSSGVYKVSMRSRGLIDVAEIAQRFGGGGHKNAAGFQISGELSEVRTRLKDILSGLETVDN